MYPWTVYCDGEVVNIATDSEAGEYMRIFKEVYLDFRTGILEIVE